MIDNPPQCIPAGYEEDIEPDFQTDIPLEKLYPRKSTFVFQSAVGQKREQEILELECTFTCPCRKRNAIKNSSLTWADVIPELRQLREYQFKSTPQNLVYKMLI